MRAVFLTVSILLLPAQAISAESMRRPIPVCGNLPNVILFDLSKSVKDKCASFGIDIPQSKISTAFHSEIHSDPDFSSMRCNATCATMEALEKKNMKECVDFMSNAFLKGFNNSFTSKLSSAQVCQNFKSKL